MQVIAREWRDETSQVLIVEDDEFYGQLLTATLVQAGFEATCATSGEEALAMIAAGSVPKCIVTDLHMPKINGFELLSRIRGQKEVAEVPVIVLSGQDEQSDIEKAFRLGATSFVPKPIHPLLLVHHVRLVLRAIRD